MRASSCIESVFLDQGARRVAVSISPEHRLRRQFSIGARAPRHPRRNSSPARGDRQLRVPALHQKRRAQGDLAERDDAPRARRRGHPLLHCPPAAPAMRAALFARVGPGGARCIFALPLEGQVWWIGRVVTIMVADCLMRPSRRGRGRARGRGRRQLRRGDGEHCRSGRWVGPVRVVTFSAESPQRCVRVAAGRLSVGRGWGGWLPSKARPFAYRCPGEGSFHVAALHQAFASKQVWSVAILA